MDSCNDPKDVFNTIVRKPEELVSAIRVLPFFDSGSNFFPNNTDLFYPIDINNYGRCYTFMIPDHHVKYGIYKVVFHFKSNVRVFVTNSGVLGVKRTAFSNFIDVPLKTFIVNNVEYSLYKLLDSQEAPCIK